MFSQLTHIRQAVESLAQQAVKNDAPEEAKPRSSLDSQASGPSSPAALRDPFVADLKKTSPQHPASPGGAARRPGQRSTLEDRLRAKLAAAHDSNSSSTSISPTLSHRASPSSQAVSVMDHPLSPASTPLPQTPPPRPTMSDPSSPKSTPLPESPALSSPPQLRIDTPQPLALGAPEPAFLHTRTLSSSSVLANSSSAGTTSGSARTDEGAHEVPRDGTSHDSAVTTPDSPIIPVDLQADPIPAVTAAASHDGHVSPRWSAASDLGELGSTTENAAAPAESVVPSTFAEATAPTLNESLLPSHTPPPAQDAGIPVTEGATFDGAEQKPSTDAPASENSFEHAAADTITNGGAVANATNGYLEHPDIREPDTSAAAADKVDIEALQKRLKLVEQRFADVSTSFKRLQAEKQAADKVLRELTSVESIKEVDGLRDFLQNADLKVEMAQDEIKRLNGKLMRQEERIEELRDIHRLESKSQSDLIDTLRAQMEEAEALLKASQGTSARHEEEAAKQKAEIERLHADNERLKGSTKEEEEKRVKAINLLKTVRQKLVKAEKERDDVTKEVQHLKEKEKEEREKDQTEKAELRKEIDKVSQEREVVITGLRTQFDKEVFALKDRYEKETLALKGQYELEAVTTKGAHHKEMEAKNSRISQLEKRVEALSQEKDNIFDQLQLRQAELESARGHLESLEGQTTEYQFQLRETKEQLALLNEELGDLRREQETKGYISGPSADEVARMLSAAESKYEARLSELRLRLSTVQRERDEEEADWSHKLSEKIKEVEALKTALKASAQPRENPSDLLRPLQEEMSALKEELRTYKEIASALRSEAAKIPEIEDAAKLHQTELSGRVSALQQHLEEARGREAQLKAQHKALRDELRKVQSSAALLEKQRGPGVGYWASRTDLASESRSPRSSMSDLPSHDNSSRPQSPNTTKSDEEVNVEYLRNVVLQFLEHKEMRPQLIRIISTILRFTPQETRRLVSKMQS